MDKEEFARKYTVLFPEREEALVLHYEQFGELLGHVFFGDENEEFIELLRQDRDMAAVRTYCDLVEEMWRHGTEAVQNIVDVTILERLSDEDRLWQKFGSYISEDFKKYINDILLIENGMMWGVKKMD